jgi:SAM-dependent methyltransferase
MTAAPMYALDNAHPDAPVHHAALAAMFDPYTTARLRQERHLKGKRCLEIGAGGGSIALWLAEQVGDDGSVLATDTKPHLIPVHPRLGLLRHDIATQPLPDGLWDVVHARLVLSHLPNRREILGRLVDHLAPGGLLLVEDWTPRVDAVLCAPGVREERAYIRFQETLARVFAAAGTDRSWGRRLHEVMLGYGLRPVRTEVHAKAWPGGSAGARLVQACIQELRPRLIDAGATEQELRRVHELLDDPRLVLHGHPMYSTSGQRG